MLILKIAGLGLVFGAVYTIAPLIFRARENTADLKVCPTKNRVSELIQNIFAVFSRLSGIFGKKQTFASQLPGALDFLAGAMRSGSSLAQGISLLAGEMPQPVSGEFGAVLREMKMGLPMQEALANLAKRVKNPDADLAVTSILISQETGASLAEVLGKISDVIRERNKIIGKANALVSQGKMQSIIVGALPVVLCAVIFFIDPLYIKPLFASPAGWLMIAAAVGMEFIGITLIRRITKIEV